MLQQTATQCNTTLFLRNASSYRATRYNILQHIAPHCTTLHRTAPHCMCVCLEVITIHKEASSTLCDEWLATWGANTESMLVVRAIDDVLAESVTCGWYGFSTDKLSLFTLPQSNFDHTQNCEIHSTSHSSSECTRQSSTRVLRTIHCAKTCM